ncbi:MAG: hypothetical protein H6732_03745 [Alphaproteobacteria bacterium]|nr:hypothetical protein [Alphaproteobacteria bacterium]
MTMSLALLALLGVPTARAEIAPECEGLPKPDDYDEQTQQDHQQNYFALVSSFSPLHAAVPHAGGRGSIGVDVGVLPPLGCAQRYVLDWTKTEDTNKSPIIPKITASYAFPEIKDRLVFYGGLALLPPIPLNGTRTLLLSAELGFGVHAAKVVDVGARFHMTLQRTYGDVATAFTPDEPVVEDVYVGSTWGIDALLSFPVAVNEQQISPYLAAGYLDASTFFFVGDSSYAAINLHPYGGPAIAVGLDTLLVKRLRLAGEFYAAPGGFTLPDADAEVVGGFDRYGSLYTARFRIGVEL